MLSFLIVLNLALFGVFSLVSPRAMWGFNHLQFVSDTFAYVFVAVVLIVAVLLFAPGMGGALRRVVSRADALVFERRLWSTPLVMLVFALLFYLFRSETHFLGDGYTNLSVYGQGKKFIVKLTEPGSILLLRTVQYWLGEYTRETVLIAGQIVAIVSGAITVFNFVGIAQKLGREVLTRLLVLITLCTSGVMLLFFGYIEFYPPLWAAASTFVNLSLRYVQTQRHLWAVLLAYAVALTMHMQALYFLPGVVYLVLLALEGRLQRRLPLGSLNLTLLLSVIGATGVAVGLAQLPGRLPSVFLPLLTGPPTAPNYAVFGTKHLLDILNLILVVFPGILVVIGSAILTRSSADRSPARNYLLLLSIGSLLFLLVVDPAIGMARDWDLMALTLLAPGLLVFRVWITSSNNLNARVAVSYTLTCAFITASYVAANTSPPASVNRFQAIVEYYGTKDDTGWPILTGYHINQEKYDRAIQLARYMEERGIRPDKTYRNLAVLLEKRGEYAEAEHYYRLVLQHRAPNASLLHKLSQVLMVQGKHQETLDVLKAAHQLAPDDIRITEHLGLTYLHTKQYDSALAIADTLFARNPHSAVGYLLLMTDAIVKGNTEAARANYEAFLEHGTDRHDYEAVKDRFRYLVEDQDQ